MKYRIVLISGILLFWSSAFAQDASSLPSLPPGHYIVVAAYLGNQGDFAQRYVSTVNQSGKHAKAGYDEGRKMNYVYLDAYADFNESIQEMQKARQAGFPTAWVRVMKGDMTNLKTNTPIENKVAEPAVVKSTTSENKVQPDVAQKDPAASNSPARRVVQIVPDSLTGEKKTTPPPVVVLPTEVIANPEADPVYRPQVLQNTPVFLSLHNPTNDKVVDGEVEVADTEKGTLITKVKGNDYLKLPDPKNKSGQITLISSSFGYRKVQHEINYKASEKDTLPPFMTLMGNYYMISFEMDRLHKGDIETLYNVYFYNDAAIMQPESKFELNKLLQMMKDNPTFRIRLHGHTNGGGTGKLISRGPSNSFFEVTSDVKRGVGSAKELSRQRAEIIRDWLVSNSVATERIDIKAWGGARMIHDKNSAHARKNVRVEVEVIDE